MPCVVRECGRRGADGAGREVCLIAASVTQSSFGSQAGCVGLHHLAPLAGRGRIASAMRSIVRCDPGEGVQVYQSSEVLVDRTPHPGPLPVKNGGEGEQSSLYRLEKAECQIGGQTQSFWHPPFMVWVFDPPRGWPMLFNSYSFFFFFLPVLL